MEKVQLNPKLLIRQSDNRFYFGMGIFLTILVFIGFWPSYFQRLLSSDYEATMVFHIHAVVFLVWMVLYISQTGLVLLKKTPVHKRIGNAGIYLGVAMFVLGIIVSILRVQRLMESGRFETVAVVSWYSAEPFVDIVQFITLLALGFINKKEPHIHKRYMLLATVAILPAATARMGYLMGPWSMELMFLLFAALILLHDWRTHGKIFKVNVFGLLFLLPRALLAMSYKF